MVLPVSASEIDMSEYNSDVQVINVSNLAIDVNNNAQLESFLAQYGFSANDIIAQAEYGYDSGNSRSEYWGGVMCVVGRYDSARQWHIGIFNFGVLTITCEADVNLYNNTLGPILMSVQNLGTIGQLGTSGRNYYGNWDIDCVVFTVTAITSQGEFLCAGGSHSR